MCADWGRRGGGGGGGGGGTAVMKLVLSKTNY